MKADTATRHRAAAALALAFAAAVVVVFAGVFVIDLRAGVAPAFALEKLPGASWPAPWLTGAVSPAEQQAAALEQWLHVIVVFGAIAFAIACVNALIGLVSHANERRYETAVRGLVGASRRQINAAFLRNALVNAGLGIAAGVPVGLYTARVVQRYWQMRDSTELAWVLVAAAACLAVAAFAARSAGARLRRAGWMGDALAPEARTLPGFGAEDLRTLLTTAQLATAVALTTVSLLVWSYASTAASSHASASRAGRFVAHVSLGEDTTPAERRDSYARILVALRQSGQVEAESIASPGALLGMGTVDKVLSDCGPCSRANMYTPLFPVETQHHVVGKDFFRAAGIAILRGRAFDGDATDAGTIVVNSLFARQAFMGQNPIGKRVLVGGFEGGRWYTVVGVVEDVKAVGLQLLEPDPVLGEAAQLGRLPAIYYSAAERTPATFDVVIEATAPPIVKAGIAFEPLGTMVARATAPQIAFSRVLTILGLLLCGAALAGSFTALMLSVRARQAEIAIRRALGARRSDVWKLVYGRVAAIGVRGVIVGLIISVALSRALEVFVPGLPLLDVRTALLVGVSFFLLSFVAALLPVREALQISPASTHH